MRICASSGDIIFAPLRPLHSLLIKSALGSDIGFNAYDRFDADFASLLVKFKGAKDIAVISNRNRRHLLARNFLN